MSPPLPKLPGYTVSMPVSSFVAPMALVGGSLHVQALGAARAVGLAQPRCLHYTVAAQALREGCES